MEATKTQTKPTTITSSTSGAMLQRKCACGNHASGGECAECKKKKEGTLQRRQLQAKLSINQPGDVYEQEADRVAQSVVSNQNPHARKPPSLFRLSRREASGADPMAVPPIVHDVLNSPGQPLDAGTREYLEPRFRHDFSNVRVHTDARAAESARSVNALAYTVGRDVVFGDGQYRPSSVDGKKLMAHELTHVVQQGTVAIIPHDELRISPPNTAAEHEAEQSSDENLTNRSAAHLAASSNNFETLQRTEGPQSFGPKKPGTEAIDSALFANNKSVEASLLGEAKRLHKADDLRWFFAWAHANITEQINRNISHFQRPNALIRLNIHFTEELLKALAGAPSKDWESAFKFCNSLERRAKSNPLLVGETELCGAKMAKVHILVDLSAALNEVGCIPPEDYGNLLVFVNRGVLAAQVQLRGLLLGVGEAMGQALLGPLIDMEVKAWRNAAYKGVCGVDVPNVEPSFSQSVN